MALALFAAAEATMRVGQQVLHTIKNKVSPGGAVVVVDGGAGSRPTILSEVCPDNWHLIWELRGSQKLVGTQIFSSR